MGGTTRLVSWSIGMQLTTKKLTEVQVQLMEEIKACDCTALDLTRQGYSSSSVRKGLPVLLAAGMIFKHGNNRATYYSDNPNASLSRLSNVRIPAMISGNQWLAMRMGYTDLIPDKRYAKERVQE